MTDPQTKTLARITAKALQLGFSITPLPEVSEGPLVTAYRFKPEGATRFNQIESLSADLAIALGVEDVFIKRLPGEHNLAIFVPNQERGLIRFLDVTDAVWRAKNGLDQLRIPLGLGVDYLGSPFVDDLINCPHLLIAGSTGSGKSTLLGSLIAALMYTCSPDEVSLILSDTKNVEFTHFVGAPHLLFDPVTNVYQTLEKMDWLLEEMTRRLRILATFKVRNILEYKALPMAMVRTKAGAGNMPFIVLIIDELADLLTDRSKQGDEGKGPSIGKICEAKLSTIVQKSRACGIHVIAATQQATVKVVAGVIKANFPARLTFRLPSGSDSRTILGTEGAEHLLSKGDMLYISPTRPGLLRLHAPYASIGDIQAVVEAASRKHQAQSA